MSKVKSKPSRSQSLCTICLEYTTDLFSSNTCFHSFCATCISKYIDSKVQANTANVKCPNPDCPAILDPQFCLSSGFVSKQVFERWGDVLCEAMILGNRRSYCPFKDCAAVMIDEGVETVSASECLNCRRMFCAQCKVGWHADMECEEFQKLRKEEGGDRDEVLTMKLAKRKKWRKCSNCRVYVEKIEGCVHITCRCSFEFCYGCGAKWDGSHACPP